MIPDLGDDEPLEEGLPDKAKPVEEFTGVPTMEAVPIPDGFAPDDEPDLDDLPIDPLS